MRIYLPRRSAPLSVKSVVFFEYLRKKIVVRDLEDPVLAYGKREQTVRLPLFEQFHGRKQRLRRSSRGYQRYLRHFDFRTVLCVESDVATVVLVQKSVDYVIFCHLLPHCPKDRGEVCE